MYNEIEMPIAPILAEMEADGIGIDGDALKVISKEFGEQMAGSSANATSWRAASSISIRRSSCAKFCSRT